MAQKRILILDESELIMVVDKDIVKQVDENRGEMNRTEFVNFLIQSQLKDYYAKSDYVNKEEFDRFAHGMLELFRNFLEFFLSWGIEMGKQPQHRGFEELSQRLEALESSGERAEEFKHAP